MKRNQNFDHNHSQKLLSFRYKHRHQPSGSPVHGWLCRRQQDAQLPQNILNPLLYSGVDTED